MVKRKRLQKLDVVGQKKAKVQCRFCDVSLNIASMAEAGIIAHVKKHMGIMRSIVELKRN